MTPAAMFLPSSAQPANESGHCSSPGPLEQPLKTTLVITEQCNLDCQLCTRIARIKSPRAELSFDAWRRIIDDLAANGVIWLYIEGGEPFLRDGFVDLLAENAHRMFLMVRTHGT